MFGRKGVRSSRENLFVYLIILVFIDNRDLNVYICI